MRLIVQGRAPLKGIYHPAGNSNEAIALIAASMLSEDSIILENVPQTNAVQMMLDMAHDLGMEYTRERRQLTLHTPKVASRFINKDHTSRPVASMLLLAPILLRRAHATLELNEPIGRLHTHITALKDLGIRIDIDGQTLNLTAKPWDKKEIVLLETSVTATALTCMLAAALGKETTIFNAASEPHLRSLQKMLVAMGAQIEGIGSNLLTIHGQIDGFRSATAHILPGHTEIAGVAAIAAMLDGHVTIDPVIPSDLRIIGKVYKQLGVELLIEDNRLHIPTTEQRFVQRIQEEVDNEVDTAPWPGFPSDLAATATVLATQAQGTTLIHEKLYNNRLLFVDKLKAMGAQIVLADPHRAVVVGGTPLRGEYIDTPDVRTGLAMLAAALCAEGTSVIDRAELIDRHFEGVIHKLIGLGAQIKIEEVGA